MRQSTNIIYMGTPDFSVPALQNLAVQDDFNVSLVVTQPDRPRGRGKKLAPSPVKTAALNMGIDVFQPEDINTEEASEKLLSLNPDFFVVEFKFDRNDRELASRYIQTIPIRISKSSKYCNGLRFLSGN
ncbi:MAG: hypothetical protein HN339_20270 [Desulfobacula sp.]|uniref:hypothetical protein n=1 Tax=Desulfobacula sp. TaxID=2593537 RepID=UPI0039B83BB4|nr:hypothetical protein [Desulfobacula sp.]